MSLAMLAGVSALTFSSGSSLVTDVFAAQITDHGETGHTDGGNVGVPGYQVHLKTYNGNYAYCIEPDKVVSQLDVYSVSYDTSGITEKMKFVAWYCNGKGGDYYAAGQHLIWEGTGAYVNGVSGLVDEINAAWERYKVNNDFNLTISGKASSSTGKEVSATAYVGSVIKITDTNGVMENASISALPSFLALCDAEGKEISGSPSGNTFYVKVKAPGTGTITVSRYTGNDSSPLVLYSPSDQSLVVAGGISSKVGRISIEAKQINVHVTKSSASPGVTDGNDCYSLENAKYGIYADEACTKKIGEITTGKDGKGSLENINPDGSDTIYIKETSASKGYMLDTQVYKAALGSTSDISISSKESPRNDPVGITLTKKDAESADFIAPLADAEFTIRYYDGQYTAESLPEEPDRTWVLKTIERNGRYYTSLGLGDAVKVSGDAFFKTAGGIITLPLGTVTVKETKAPVGYTLEGAYLNTANNELPKTSDGAVVLNITEDGTSANGATLKGGNEYTKEDKAIYGSVKFNKRDYESKQASALGGATLEGTEVELVNDGDDIVRYQGKEFKKGETVDTVKTDKNGFYQFPEKSLSYGDYLLREKTAPDGYLHAGILEQKFSIREDGEIVDMTSADKSIQNKVERGDFDMRKINGDSQKTMANIEFRITSMTTGESHTVMTDANGYYSSEASWNKHTYDTNGGKADSGLWFGLYKADGSDEYSEMTEPDDSLGALPYDTYMIEEIRGKNNENMTMFSDIFTISRDKYTVHLNNVENEEMVIITQAHNNIDGKKIVPATEEAVIIDTVSYEGLVRNKEYTLVTYLADGETGELLKDASGSVITGETAFTPKMKTGTVDVELKFDASLLQGKTGVIFEYLYEGSGSKKEGPVSRHNDLEDRDQTVIFPEIRTNANDRDTKEHVSASGDITIIDTVSYKNLIKGDRYTVTGTLMNKETGEKHLDDNGSEITAQAEFKAEDSEGTVDVEFTFRGVDTTGTAVVAFEELYYSDILFAVHADISDEDQTVYFPEIHTMAQSETGIKNVMAGEESKIIDTVSYEWAKPGLEYTLVTKLYDKTDGKMLDTVLEHSVKAAKKDGEWPVEIVFDSTNLLEHDIVVFEYLYYNDAEITKHEDKEDKDQTITIESPQLEKYVNKDVHQDLVRFHEPFTYDIMAYITSDAVKATITDTLADELAFVSDEPSVLVQVMDGKNNHTVHGTVEENGTDIEAAVEISGQDLTVTIENAEPYRGKWIRVTFDAKIRYDMVKVDELGMAEITDNIRVLEGVAPHTGVPNKAGYEITADNEGKYELESNTVTVTPPEPEIRTTAADGKDGDKNVLLEGKTIVKDTVEYKNLEEDYTYIISGMLVSKQTGKAVLIDGKPAEAEIEFKPEDINGTAEVTFEFDGTSLRTNTYVVFEKLYVLVEKDGSKTPDKVEITSHEDINDEDQTVNMHSIVYASVLKVDSADHSKVLKNAEFTVYDKKTNEIAKDIHGKEMTGRTDENGLILFEMEESDSGYYVKETKAPEGYRLNQKKYEIRTSENKGYAKDNPVEITIEDRKNTSPNTADFFDDSLFAIFGLSGIAAIAAILILARDRKMAAE